MVGNPRTSKRSCKPGFSQQQKKENQKGHDFFSFSNKKPSRKLDRPLKAVRCHFYSVALTYFGKDRDNKIKHGISDRSQPPRTLVGEMIH